MVPGQFRKAVSRLGRVCSLGLAAACGKAADESAKALDDAASFSVVIVDSAGQRIATFSPALDLRARPAAAVSLSAPAALGSSFEHIADVAPLPNGNVAVLDRRETSVVIVSPDGAEVRRFGRKGDGPGEFFDPHAIAAIGPLLVVRDGHQSRPFLLFDTAGSFVRTIERVSTGDWNAYYTRQLIPRVTDAPYRMPMEDLTRRLFPLDDSTFGYVLQDAETQPPASAPPGAVLLAIDVRGRLRDTLDAAPAPVDFPGLQPRNLAQQMYVGRPLWAAGAGWLARAHGDSTSVLVQDDAGRRIMTIRLPSERSPIQPADREQFADWYFEEDVLKHGQKEMREQAQKLSRSARSAYAKQIIDRLSWATTAPTITALHADGDCLWLGAFAPADYPDGTALTWVVLNLSSGAPSAYRIPARGSRVRALGHGFLYATRSDENGVQTLERYAVPCR